MKIPFAKLITTSNLLLLASIVANVALLLACAILFSKLKTLYVDYRHFRGLPVGVSEASQSDVSENVVILFGDSRVETWKPLPNIAGKTIVNAGVTGETTSEMRRRFEHDVLRLKPETVIIQAGMNDLTANVTLNIPNPEQHLQRMHANLEYFVSTLTTMGVQVILTSVIPNSDLNLLRKAFWNTSLPATVADSNNKLKQLAGDYRATWLDISHVFHDQDNKIRSNLYRDTLHINPFAYELVNAIIEDQFSEQ